jgi:uncharacterized protein (DUF2062 family)
VSRGADKGSRKRTAFERFRDDPRSQRFIAWLQGFLRMGLTPDAIALGLAVGIVVGIFPIFGITTFIAAGLALSLRLNMVLVQSVNYLMAPIHILMILPWIRIGEHLFRRPTGPLTAKEIFTLIQNHPWEALDAVGMDLLRAAGAWALASPLLILLLYWSLRPLCRKIGAHGR